MINYQIAKKILKKSIIKIKDEKIKSVNSLNRVASANIYSSIDYPSGNNAAFDGFAINSKDTKNINKKINQKFKIIGSIAAGVRPFKKIIKRFDTVEIMTGGIIPNGFDTIVPIEKIVFSPSIKSRKYILINKKVDKFNHVRFKGSDYKKNEIVLKKNSIIQPNHILTFKTLGIKNISVKKKNKYFIFFNWK